MLARLVFISAIFVSGRIAQRSACTSIVVSFDPIMPSKRAVVVENAGDEDTRRVVVDDCKDHLEVMRGFCE